MSGGNSTGSFGSSTLSLDVPGNLASLCGAREGIKKLTLSGTLSAGEATGSWQTGDQPGPCAGWGDALRPPIRASNGRQPRAEPRQMSLTNRRRGAPDPLKPRRRGPKYRLLGTGFGRVVEGDGVV